MSYDVIMPALGMAQETGRVVAWLRTVGEPISEGDPLFEVETDKAVMEVPAPAAGFLSAVTVDADEEAAVGAVIARIVETVDEVEHSAGQADADAQSQAPAPNPIPASREAEPDPSLSTPESKSEIEAETPTEPWTTPDTQTPVAGARVLASPKARRLAHDRGLDLAMLRAQGVTEPIRAEDLEKAVTGQMSVLSARADATALDALLANAAPDTDQARLLAAFAAGAWRSVFATDEPAILIRWPDGATDQIGGDQAVCVLVDLTSTHLAGYTPGTGGTTMTVARDGAALVLKLTCNEARLPFAAAVAFLDEMVARLEDPVRQLM